MFCIGQVSNIKEDKMSMASGFGRISLFAITLGLCSVAAAPIVASPTYTGRFSNMAAEGYDVTSYFTGTGTPQKGNEKFAVKYAGATFLFATAANAAKFKATPVAFAPQYGGYCAWAVAGGYLAPGDPKKYKVINKKVYLNYNQEVQDKWLKDVPGFISKADVNWPEVQLKK
jgi:YHS domain-containing protein